MPRLYAAALAQGADVPECAPAVHGDAQLSHKLPFPGLSNSLLPSTTVVSAGSQVSVTLSAPQPGGRLLTWLSMLISCLSVSTIST